jgi:hypothetical protein
MNWYLITRFCVYGMQDTRDIEGMYTKGRILPIGSIVPQEWKGRQAIQDLYLPANYLEAYEPDESDWNILYMLWSGVRPNDFKAQWVENSRIKGANGQWAAGWYQIQAPDERRSMSSVPYGVSALMDVDGVCKAGDVAMAGDIVPAAFFAGLSYEQFDRLETIGLCSPSWLNNHPARARGDYLRHFARPVMQRVAVDPQRREMLYKKYPALNPNAVIEAPKAPSKAKTTRKG